MLDYFKFRDKKTSEFNAYVANGDVFDSPTRKIEPIVIPGRNGTLTPINSDTFENQKITYNCYVKDHARENISKLLAYLNSFNGYQKLEDTLRADCYRLARFNGEFKANINGNKGATFSVSFDCQPQKFLKIGLEWIKKENVKEFKIENNTAYSSKPIIRIAKATKKDITISVGNEIIKIQATGELDKFMIEIDCEKCQGYSLKNGDVYSLIDFSQASGISLKANSDTIIKIDGCQSVEVQPRWFII